MQAESGHTRTRGGTGLGLTINRQLTRLKDSVRTRSLPLLQRARLGWTEEALRREYGILREEIDMSVRRTMQSSLDVDVDGALGLLRRFIDRAEQISVRSLLRALLPRENA